ncbi:GDSL-type esterase/lipase family protein [Brevibacterium samyangense]|uniref:GDSL-type esterase/lipase family protein n=1 Tax=Brevibacterium samyangense TaxID=366888 RepID=A0ABP5EMC4_9MICO
MSARARTAIVVAGGDLVSGHGDGRGLGWVGRVALRTTAVLPSARFHALGVPGEDSAALHDRCMTEAERRFSVDGVNRLVLAPSASDVVSGLSIARSRLNLANILDDALSKEVGTFVVGPPPARGTEVNERIHELSNSFSDVAVRRGITYVDTFTPLVDHPVWQRELALTEDGLPGQEGYGLLAWLVLNRGWFDWLGVADPLDSGTTGA